MVSSDKLDSPTPGPPGEKVFSHDAMRKSSQSFINFLTHLHPAKIPHAALDLKRTWGLGGMSLVLILMLAFSGTLMLFVYRPLPEFAYGSIRIFQDTYLFGKFVRSLHYFSANLLVIISACHLLRIFFTQSFHAIRRFNWIIGLACLVLILTSCFTGYLLPWDQTAYWAITICLGMFEYLPVNMDLKITATTLQLFYILHTTIIPICFLFLLPLHFWKIRKAKGIALPDSDDKTEQKLASVPNLVLRELVVALVLIALIMTLSAIFQAPLGDMANPGLSPNPAKAPWYFLGFQELLLHFHPLFAVFIAPGTLLLLMIFLPYKKYETTAPTPWFISAGGKKTGCISVLAGSLIIICLVLLDEFSNPITGHFPGMEWVPLLGFFLFIPVYYHYLKKSFNLSNNESIQALFILVFTMYLTLTSIGIWFRGEGMKLIWGIFI